MVVAVISDTILLRSEVMGSPVGSKSVSVADPVADPVADSAAESEDVRLVGCTISLGGGPVEALSLVVAVISDRMLLRSEVMGSPVGSKSVTLALVRVVPSELADDAGGDTVLSAELAPVAEDCSVKIVVASAVVASAEVASAEGAVEASSMEVAVGASSAEVAVGASSSVALVGETTVSDAVVLELVVSDSTSLAVVINTGPDGPRLVRMSDNERLWLDEESDVIVSVVVEGSGVAISVTVALVNCLLTSRGKYIFRLATGSAPAKVEAATSAETNSDLVCILSIYWQFIRTDRPREVW